MVGYQMAGAAPAVTRCSPDRRKAGSKLLGKQLMRTDRYRYCGRDRSDRSAEHEPGRTPTASEDGDNGPPHWKARLGRRPLKTLRVFLRNLLPNQDPEAAQFRTAAAAADGPLDRAVLALLEQRLQVLPIGKPGRPSYSGEQDDVQAEQDILDVVGQGPGSTAATCEQEADREARQGVAPNQRSRVTGIAEQRVALECYLA